VLLKSGEYRSGLPFNLYPGIPYPIPSTASGTARLIAARTCSNLGPNASGCAAMYLSTAFGTGPFIPLFYVSARPEEVASGGRQSDNECSATDGRPGARC
jgi:hypothetical protein